MERDPDDLVAWLGELRGRLERGELAGLGPINAGGGVVFADGEFAVRVMLADLDHYADLTPAQRREPRTAARRRLLLDDFRRLRERLG